MILITDSGSSKCTWCLVQNAQDFQQTDTTGINPSTQNDGLILHILKEEVLPGINGMDANPEDITQIYFYGAGCTPLQKERMKSILSGFFPRAGIEVESDLLGAARALLGKEKGIACILGTGANSCLYDGREIVCNTPSLGYILGDEGSGAYLGKMFLRSLFKGKLPEDICMAFKKENKMNMADVIERIYRREMPNRFLASMAPFLHRHKENTEINKIIHDAFEDFINFNLTQYKKDCIKVSFTGSVAFFFEKELKESLLKHGYKLDRITRKPIEGLVNYHLTEKMR